MPVNVSNRIRTFHPGIRTFRKEKEDNKTTTLSDFAPVTVEEMENHHLANDEMGPAGRYPFPIDFFKRSIHNQNLICAMIFGAGLYPDREGALEF